MVEKNRMVRNAINQYSDMVLCSEINNFFNKLGNIKMSKQEIIEQLKNIKEQYLNDTKNEIDAEVIIEAITDVIHDTEGNDGMDFTEIYDDEHYDSFENVDFTALDV